MKRINRGTKRKAIASYFRKNGINLTNWTIPSERLAEIIRQATGKRYAYKNASKVINAYYKEMYSVPIINKPDVNFKEKKQPLSFVQTDVFLESFEWRQLRYSVLKKSDGKCQLCGRSKHDGVVLNVDHIKPRKTHPELALNRKNLQVLCHECNHGKSNSDDTDWREPIAERPHVRLIKGGRK